MAVKRLIHELNLLQSNCLEWATFKIGTDVFIWEGIVMGPPGCVYENGVFRFQITFPTDYPFKQFRFRFLTPLKHPNFSKNGGTCCSFPALCDSWSPAFSVFKLLPQLRDLFVNPENEDTCHIDESRELKADRIKYASDAKKNG